MNAPAATIPRPSTRGFGPGVVVCVCALALILMGLVVLSSAGQEASHDAFFIFRRQLTWFGIGLLVTVGMATVNLDRLRRYTWVMGAIAVVLLALVLVPHLGLAVKGARRWFNLGFMRAQPSDFGKLALVFCLAHYLGNHQRQVQSFWRGFVAPMAIIAIFAGLIIREPDFGTAALCGMVGCTLLFLAGVRLLFLFPSMLAGAGLFTVMVIYDPVRMKRILSFMDMDANKSDGSYQLWQALVGFGVGGLHGVGLGQGLQQRYFLPEAHTDFVLAIVGEELGLLATAGIAVTFLIIFFVAFRALRRAPNLYEFTLAAGSLLLLIGQAVINMGVVTGLLPTKGMSLPFISYGGSNLLLMCALVGLLVNCFRRWDRPVLRTPREL